MRRSIRVGAATVAAAMALSACAAEGTLDEGEPAAARDGAAAEEPVAAAEDDPTATGAAEADETESVTGGAEAGTHSTDPDADRLACPDLSGAGDLDPDELTDRLVATLEEPAGAFRADADLNPLTKAVLLVDANEPELPRVRYRVRFASAAGDDGAAADLVQVERFNLGPTVRDELLATLGEDAVAPPEAFGEGPHVTYCLEVRTIQGMTADLVAVTRAELPVDAPTATTCLGVGCDGTASVADAATTWQEGGELALPTTGYDALRDGVPGPAVALDLAVVESGLATRDGDTIRWHGPEPREGLAPGEPFIEAVIDVGLGQDIGVDLALREGHIMDHTIEAVWQRITGLGTGDPDRPLLLSAAAVEERPAG